MSCLLVLAMNRSNLHVYTLILCCMIFWCFLALFYISLVCYWLFSVPFFFLARCMIDAWYTDLCFIGSGVFTSDTRKCFDTGIMKSDVFFFFRDQTKYSTSLWLFFFGGVCVFVCLWVFCVCVNQMTYILLLHSNEMYILNIILHQDL